MGNAMDTYEFLKQQKDEICEKVENPWKPIASCPRDGHFLAFSSAWKKPRIMHRITGGYRCSFTWQTRLKPTMWAEIPRGYK